jgi:hypothetical protein
MEMRFCLEPQRREGAKTTQNFFAPLLFPLLCMLFLSSCEVPTDWDFQPTDNGVLVVEAIITDEFGPQELRLSLSYDALNGQPAPATGAVVQISGGGETHAFQEASTAPGRYVSQQPFAAKLNTDYSLEIEWAGASYSAQNRMVQVVPFQPVTFAPYGATDSMIIANEPALFSPHEQAMHQIDIDWTHLIPGDTSRAKVIYYTFNTIDVSGLFRPEKKPVPFPRGSIVVQSKYSLDPAFAAYCRALMMETEWQGGVFDEASASLPTNVRNGGLGFFAVCAVLRDTLVAE